MNPAAPVTSVVARVSVAMRPVCRANEAPPTDNTRTRPVRHTYKAGIRAFRHEGWPSGVMWRAAQSTSRGCGLHQGGARDNATVDLPRRVRAAFGDQVTLLMVDNFEQVVDAAPLIADLLTSVPLLKVLQQHSKVTTCGRRGFWVLDMRSLSARVSRLWSPSESAPGDSRSAQRSNETVVTPHGRPPRRPEPARVPPPQTPVPVLL